MGEWNLTIVQGEDLEETYAWTQDGVRQSFDGWEISSQIRSLSGVLLLDLEPYLTVQEDVEVAEGDIGQALHLDIPADITRTVTRGGHWDLYLTQGDDGERFLYGTVTLVRAVTVDE